MRQIKEGKRVNVWLYAKTIEVYAKLKNKNRYVNEAIMEKHEREKK